VQTPAAGEVPQFVSSRLSVLSLPFNKLAGELPACGRLCLPVAASIRRGFASCCAG
jgi:hypothetical protein